MMGGGDDVAVLEVPSLDPVPLVMMQCCWCSKIQLMGVGLALQWLLAVVWVSTLLLSQQQLLMAVLIH